MNPLERAATDERLSPAELGFFAWLYFQSNIDIDEIEARFGPGANEVVSLKGALADYVTYDPKRFTFSVKGASKEGTEAFRAFDDFRRRYRALGGSVRGCSIEFENFKKRCKDWPKVVHDLHGILERQAAEREWKRNNARFVPEWAALQVWVNQKRWTLELDAAFERASAQSGSDAGSGNERYDSYLRWAGKVMRHDHRLSLRDYLAIVDGTGQCAGLYKKISVDRVKNILRDAHYEFDRTQDPVKVFGSIYSLFLSKVSKND